MKTLFLGLSDFNDHTGGSMCSRRNYECLCEVVGKENVDVSILSMHHTRRKYFGNMLLHKTIFDTVENKDLRFDQYQYVFIDSCLLANNLLYMRRNGFKGKSFIFFHNCEFDFQQLTKKGNGAIGTIIHSLYMRYVKYQESLSLKLADACIFLNQRDANRLQEIYNVTPRKTVILPMSIKDRFDPSMITEIDEPRERTPLFTLLGSFFPPNVDGASWFIQNVLPYVNIRFRIVGKDMHKLKDILDCSKVEIFSNVPDLMPYLLETDYMLFPIFDGSGMKVKTCESLMYGKNIIGTPEAFSGYLIDEYKKVGACCATADEFIQAINTLNMPRFNRFNREHYLMHFSYNSTIAILREVLN